MFKNMDRKRLMELAGIELPKEASSEVDSDAGLHGEQPTGGTEEHLDKETSVFDKVHDALTELLMFLHSQENFEEKRGKESEYAQMEQDAENLKQTMKKHLSGYEGGEEDEPESKEDEDIKMVKPNKMSFR